MKWRGRRQSTNIRDLRSSSGTGGFGGGLGGGSLGRGLPGGMGRSPIGMRRAGGGGIAAVIVILVVAYALGINPLELLSGGGSLTQTGGSQQTAQSGGNDEMRAFVATVLADTEDTWSVIFQAASEDYPEPTLTLFTGSVRSGCGAASAATGPFYCPADRNLYIDLGFYDQLRQRFGAPGDFAQAYVLAHEVGHHVQNVLGILPKVHEAQRGQSQAEANALSVLTELQADCFAGIWGHHTEQRGLLEAGDVEEAITAAAAIGDDTLQKQGQGYVVPDSFTHGTSEQRVKWFRRGFDEGTIDACNTFASQS